jgi:hypothetical protein
VDVPERFACSGHAVRDGEPLAGARVVARREGRKDMWRSREMLECPTGSDGSFRFELAAGESYSLQLYDPLDDSKLAALNVAVEHGPVADLVLEP